MNSITLSVVIPTYNRGVVLLDTIELLSKQTVKADAIYIVDQTDYVDADPVRTKLQTLHESNVIDWVRLDKPSIPVAMNLGLQKARSDYVLFLDDDVHFSDDFLYQHHQAILRHRSVAHVGQIIQPWQTAEARIDYQSGTGIKRDLDFPFHSNESAEIANCMAGNLCVDRRKMRDVGGFDQRFDGVAYRFETEFCRRLVANSGELFRFEPLATLNHLKVNSGGTRDHAQSHLTSLSASHSVGDYYFAMGEMKRSGQVWPAMKYMFSRFFGSMIARFYLQQPWYIPVRLISELMGVCKAMYLRTRGPMTLS